MMRASGVLPLGVGEAGMEPKRGEDAQDADVCLDNVCAMLGRCERGWGMSTIQEEEQVSW